MAISTLDMTNIHYVPIICIAIFILENIYASVLITVSQ